MAVFDFIVRAGTTKRIKVDGVDANGGRYDYTDKTVEFIVRETPTTPDPPSLLFTLEVSALGAGTSDPASRMFLGRPDEADLDGVLVDTEATSGYLTIRIAPSDSMPLSTTANVDYVWEARVLIPGEDNAYQLGSGKMTVEDTLFSAS